MFCQSFPLSRIQDNTTPRVHSVAGTVLTRMRTTAVTNTIVCIRPFKH